jgi:hypothetical protein
MHTVNAAALKIPLLYHYQPYKTEWIEPLLLQNRLFFPNPRRFNDPWDFKPNFNTSVLDDPQIYERHVEWIEATSRKFRPHLSEDMHLAQAKRCREDRNYLEWFIGAMSEGLSAESSRRYRVYCLSTKPDIQLMWAHYASSHAGICLEFSCENEIFGTAIRVEYRSAYPVFDLSDNEGNIVLLPWTTKSEVWSYENEFRVIGQERNSNPPGEVLRTRSGLSKFRLTYLNSIILGCSIDVRAKQEIASIVRRQIWPPTQLKQMKRSHDKYDLVMENV